MSKTGDTLSGSGHVQGELLKERVKQLEDIEEELVIAANSDTPYAKHAKRLLHELREATDE